MAEEKNETKKSASASSTSTSSSTPAKIEVVGPVDNNSGSSVLRFVRDAESKPPIDIVPGQVLTVGGNGGDVTKAEAERLLAYTRWEFKEVNE